MSSPTPPQFAQPPPHHRQPIAETSIGSFIEALGAKQPTPGGGAAALIVLALAAALGRMVVAYSQGKKRLAEHEPLFKEAIASLDAHATSALELADMDAAAYGRLNELWKLPKDDPRRVAGWGDAIREAIDAPLAALHSCVDVLERLEQLTGRSSRALASDLAIAAILAHAAARAAAWNVRINLPHVADVDDATRCRAETETALARARELAEKIEHACGGAP